MAAAAFHALPVHAGLVLSENLKSIKSEVPDARPRIVRDAIPNVMISGRHHEARHFRTGNLES
jgi:hypothetical protein